MGNPSMTPLYRLGVSTLWQSTKKHDSASSTFWQERSVLTYISQSLEVEAPLKVFNRDLYKYSGFRYRAFSRFSKNSYWFMRVLRRSKWYHDIRPKMDVWHQKLDTATPWTHPSFFALHTTFTRVNRNILLTSPRIMRGLRLTYVNLAGYTVGDMSKSSESTQMLLIISATLRYYSNTARAVYFGRGARVDSFDR